MTYATIPDFSAGALTSAELNIVVDAINALFPVGFYGYICQAATTSETLVNGVWLECNGLSVLRATYPDLNTKLSALGYPFGTADGTHMTLPDAQGRAPVSMSSGGNTHNDQINDNDGQAKASRTQITTISGGSAASKTGTVTFTTGNARVDSGGGTTFSPFLTGLTDGIGVSGGGGGGGTVTQPYIVAGTLFIKAKA